MLEKDWGQLVLQAQSIRNDLQGQCAHFKKLLISGVKDLVVNVVDFRKKFDAEGPAVKGIAPKDALNRLKVFTDEY